MKLYIIAPLIISLIIGLTIPVPVQTQQHQHPSLGIMTITVRDSKGNIIQQFSQPINGPTKQFADILSLLFANQPEDVYRYTVAEDGSNIKIGIYQSSSPASYTFIILADTENRVYIGFGNSSSPSYSITKYSLDNLLAKVKSSNPSIGISNDNITITISASYSPSTDVNITEVGIYYRVDQFDSTLNNYADLLIIYDVLSQPVSVPSGGSITVTYNFVIKI